MATQPYYTHPQTGKVYALLKVPDTRLRVSACAMCELGAIGRCMDFEGWTTCYAETNPRLPDKENPHDYYWVDVTNT